MSSEILEFKNYIAKIGSLKKTASNSRFLSSSFNLPAFTCCRSSTKSLQSADGTFLSFVLVFEQYRMK